MNADLPVMGPAVGCVTGVKSRPLGGCWRRKRENDHVYTCGDEEANDIGVCAKHLAELKAASAADLEREAA